MLLGSVARSSLRSRAARDSYLEISNYVRAHRIPSPSRMRCCMVNTRPFSVRSRFNDEHKPQLASKHGFLEDYKKSVEIPTATHDIQSLVTNNTLGQTVILHGYLGNRSDLSKKLSFIRLTDPTMRQNIQIVASAKSGSLDKLKSISPNSPVVVWGKVQQKKGGASDGKESVETLEIDLDDIKPLNEFPKDIIMTPETIFPPERRYLQLRNEYSLREALRFRSQARSICRAELENLRPSFVEIETPLLFKSTPEGAREFLVPTRRPGMAYALPQSPQQYKQMLMASGIPRYYQFARCFRDEDLRADRQPEFTQLDLEMSFATSDDVMSVIEGIIRSLWSSLMPEPAPAEKFRRITYEYAMANYGIDKPDTRFGMEIRKVGHLLPVDLVSKITPLTDPIVEAIKLAGDPDTMDPTETRQFVTKFLDSPAGSEFLENPDGGPGVFVYDARKPMSGLQAFGFEAAEHIEDILELEHGDLVILQARKNAPFSGGSTPIGELRRALHKAAVDTGFKPAPTGFDFLWVTDFPLFSPSVDSEPGQGGTAGIASTHHPFTAPKTAEDVELLLTDPTKAVADHYDIVVNGVELGGGSRRIHDARVQEFILKDILKMRPERLADFSHLLDALAAGCPPHAGLALGFDRLVAVMLGKESVRDVIAFPKTGKGEDAMVKCPSEMTEEALKTYHLKLRE
ncbi:aspartyl-tRNA synthetase 2, mitochondrial [Arachnomyces sp. PD_36]|nr:aspartyl-tRNA synthetase 2, mitochondrial [Arachnomyces sp. PD_36]